MLPIARPLVLLCLSLCLASCAISPAHESARLIISHPVNGSSSSSTSTRLILTCAGACDDREALVTFSSGENLQVHTSASVDVEDLPLGLNKVSVELLAADGSAQGPRGVPGFRDEVIFFVVRSDEEEDNEWMDFARSLTLQPPSGAVAIGSKLQLSVLSQNPISSSLIERLSARVDGPIFGHSSPSMSVPDEFHVIIEGYAIESGTGTVSVLIAGHNIVGSPLSLKVQERIIPHTNVLPVYDNHSTRHEKCWATIVTSPSFVLGAIALGYSLNPKSTSNINVTKIALVTSQVPFVDRCVLTAAGWLLRNVSVIPNPNPGHVAHFSSVYSKLHVFALENACQRVVYADADILAVDSHAALQLFDVHLEGYALAASPEINPPSWFNSGVLVFDPSKALLDEIMEQAQHLQSYDKTDQGMLNELFIQRWKMLSYTFNFLKDTGALADRFHWFTKERWHLIKLVHITGKKPWQCVADNICNVPGRQSTIIWDFWWKTMNEACDHLPSLSCDFR